MEVKETKDGEKRMRSSNCGCRVRENEGLLWKMEPLDEEERMERGIGREERLAWRDKVDIVEFKVGFDE